MPQAIGCPICGREVKSLQPNAEFDRFSCDRCGNFNRWCDTSDDLVELLAEASMSSIVSHHVRIGQKGNPYRLTRERIPFFRRQSLPPLWEQIENIVRVTAERQRSPSEPVVILTPELAALAGAPISPAEQALQWLMHQREATSYFDMNEGRGDAYNLRLNLSGWKLYSELLRGRLKHSVAFMAMKFGDDTLNRMLDICFRPAVKQTGFELQLLTDGQQAGIIDNQIRVAIRKASFVLADLTHDNNGAYFEAGFAEGLDIPVIYLCEQEKFRQKKTHFDTNHCVTIPWDVSNPDRAASLLKATIRATLPQHARMED